MTGHSTDTSEDQILGGRVHLRQPIKGYRVAIDPIFLAAGVKAQAGQSLLDLGCGTGAVGLCLSALVPGLEIWGLEKNPALADLAKENVRLNACGTAISILEGDLLAPPTALPARFDHVLANPPYDGAGKARLAKTASKQCAHQEGDATLVDWLDFALSRLKPDGEITLIMRASRLQEITAWADRAGLGRHVLSLVPKAGRPAKRCLVWIAAGEPLQGPTQNLVLHQEDGRYSKAAEAILSGRARLQSLVSNTPQIEKSI